MRARPVGACAIARQLLARVALNNAGALRLPWLLALALAPIALAASR